MYVHYRKDKIKSMETWNVEAFCGYTPKTTFWEDFVIAEHFGTKAIKDTYVRAFESWKDDYVYLTELVMVLNHKIWRWYEINDEYARLYDSLWRKADAYACNNLKGEELSYFFRTTD